MAGPYDNYEKIVQSAAAIPSGTNAPTVAQPVASKAESVAGTTPSSQYEAIISRMKSEGSMPNMPVGPVSGRDSNMPSAPANTGYNTTGYNTASSSYADQINDLYDKMYNQEIERIKTGYDESRRALEEAKSQLPATYQTQENALAGQYERQRANLNEQLAANGLNTGAGSQAALAQGANYASGQAQIKQAQADAQAALDRESANLEAKYQAEIKQALLDSDYQRAVALMQEMKDSQSRALEQAKLLAGYGDFSGYASIYGQDTADNMRAVWMAQNPAYAYMTGNLSAEDYYKLTGQYPADYKSPSTGYTYTPPTQPPEEEPDREIPTYGDGMDARRFGDVMTRINTSGSAADALSAFQSIGMGGLQGMSEAQRKAITEALSSKGVNVG